MKYGCGDLVNVKALPGDRFPNFTGYVTGFCGNNVIVTDQDGDEFECEVGQISHSSDEIMS